MDKMLKVRDLVVLYHTGELRAHQAVAGISFDIASGEVVGLMGESGCGKSSIAMALLGILARESTAVSGSVSFRDHELLKMGE